MIEPKEHELQEICGKACRVGQDSDGHWLVYRESGWLYDDDLAHGHPSRASALRAARKELMGRKRGQK